MGKKNPTMNKGECITPSVANYKQILLFRFIQLMMYVVHNSINDVCGPYVVHMDHIHH